VRRVKRSLVPSTYYVAWWNLENLFDEENSPRRTEKLQRTIGADLVGWTPARRDKKISQLASVIAQMNSGAGPDLLGVCEVENRFVLDLLVATVNTPLPGRNYDIVHADTEDARGIDVAFIYDSDLFTAPPTEVFFHVVMRRNATRELVPVNFQTRKNRTWTVFGNHWPSRSGGQFESAGYRDIAGETLSHFHERALEVHGPDTPAVAMGDLQRRAIRYVTRHPRAQHSSTAKSHRRRQPAVLEPQLDSDRETDGRQLLLQQRAEPARPDPRQQNS
jgi:hypothetical protein